MRARSCPCPRGSLGRPRRPRVCVRHRAEGPENLLGMVNPGAFSGRRFTGRGVVELIQRTEAPSPIGSLLPTLDPWILSVVALVAKPRRSQNSEKRSCVPNSHPLGLRSAGYVSTLSRRCELALPKDREVRVLVRACVQELRSNAPPIVRGLPTPLPPTRRSRTPH
jgi:hypothetical protein